MKPTRKQIERAARAIRFMLPEISCDSTVRRVDGVWSCGYWTDNGVRTTKWPKEFTKVERKLIRAIAKVALEAAK